MIRLRLATSALLSWACVLFSVSGTFAFSTGIDTSSFPNPTDGCNFCHNGGTAPLVSISGPTSVAAGSTNEYTMIITDMSMPAGQPFGGLNVSALDGTFAVGGSQSASTQVLFGEITHTAPKAQGGSGSVEFSFLWTAPLTFTSVTLEGWGNAVDFNSNISGDRATMTSLEVFNASAPTPTPTSTATPTATPAPPFTCPSDISPLDPVLITDKDEQNCQKTIGKAGFVYLKKKLKAVQTCLNNLQKGKIVGDPIDVCRGTLNLGVHTPPTDAKTAEKVAKADSKLRLLIDKKCTDPILANLDTCAADVSGLKDCLVENHWQSSDDLIALQYGALVPSSDSDEQKCQKTIANEGRKFATKALKFMQKCIDKRNKDGVAGNAAQLCIGSVVAGVYIPPTDAKTADKLAKFETKVATKIPLKCTTAQLGALDSCAPSPAAEVDCILCSHRESAINTVALNYGGVP